MKLFTPLRLREIEFKNRIGVSPMCEYSAKDGHPGSMASGASRQPGCGRRRTGDDRSLRRARGGADFARRTREFIWMPTWNPGVPSSSS